MTTDSTVPLLPYLREPMEDLEKASIRLYRAVEKNDLNAAQSQADELVRVADALCGEIAELRGRVPR